MSTFENRSAGPGRTGAYHLPLASGQLVRHGDRQIQSMHDRTARRPYHRGSITYRSIATCLQLEWGADDAPAWHGKLRGRLRRHPSREVQNLEPHVAAEVVQRDQADGVRVVEAAKSLANVARFYRGCAPGTARHPAANYVTHEGGRFVVCG